MYGTNDDDDDDDEDDDDTKERASTTGWFVFHIPLKTWKVLAMKNIKTEIRMVLPRHFNIVPISLIAAPSRPFSPQTIYMLR